MDWSHFWSDVALFAQARLFIAVLVAVLVIVAGLAVVITPVVIDHITRKMDGLKGLAGCLGWCVGFALALSGAMGLITSIFAELFILVLTGSIVGPNPSSQLASLAVTATCGLLGGSLA